MLLRSLAAVHLRSVCEYKTQQDWMLHDSHFIQSSGLQTLASAHRMRRRHGSALNANGEVSIHLAGQMGSTEQAQGGHAGGYVP